MPLTRAETNRREQVYSGFLPSEDRFAAALDAQIDDILGQLPVGRESFNADLAARGIFSSGEAPEQLYRSVYAPITRAATSAIADSRLRFNQLTLQGNVMAEGFREGQRERDLREDLFQRELDERPKWWQEAIGQVVGGAAMALPFLLPSGGGTSSSGGHH